MIKSRGPIGIFDSGVGGLTVMKELIRELPGEDIVYFGDTARVPYGTKSRETVIRFSVENILFLLKHEVKLIVVACNTSSSVALDVLRRDFKVPLIGVIEPGASDALRATRTGRIGIIGTSTTVKSRAYEKRLRKDSPAVKVFAQSCPLFVPLAEEGWLGRDVTRRVVREYLDPLKKKGIDTLILGCTHYPLLKKDIARVMGRDVALIDSAVSTAGAVKEFLRDNTAYSKVRSRGRRSFFVTDEPERFKKIGEGFLGKRIGNIRKVANGL